MKEQETIGTKVTVNLFSPYEAQKQVVKACMNPKIKYVVYDASRQSGKTFLLGNMAVYYALSDNDQVVMIVSPVDAQSKKLYKQILNSIIHLPAVRSYKIQAGISEILFHNGSVILFRSAASTNSLRGNSVNYLLLDECAFIDSEVWTTILAPTLVVAGKKVLFCSTPKGKNFFYELYQLGLNDSFPEYISFKTTYRDNPYANMEFIRGQQETLPIDVFRQEYEAEFVDGGQLFKDVVSHCTMTPLLGPINGDTYFAGVDIGFKKDFTVCSIFNDRSEMVYMERFNNTTNDEIITRLSSVLKKFNVAKCYVESNSFGLPIIEQLLSRGCNMVEGFATTSTSKPLIVNDAIFEFNSGNIKLLNNKNVISEMEAFGFAISKTGNITYKSNYGNDDIPMSIAIALHCIKNNRYAGQFIFI